jgi:hypothetical protein
LSIPKQIRRRVLAHRRFGHAATDTYVEVILPTSAAATPRSKHLGLILQRQNHFCLRRKDDI